MAAPPPSDAFARAPAPSGSVWRNTGLHLRWNLAICLVIAVFLSLVLHDGFINNLVISLCIGLFIQAFIELGRVAIARALQRRGVDRPDLREGWPGWAWMGPWVVISALLGHELGMVLGARLTGLPLTGLSQQTNQRTLFLVLGITLLVSAGFTYHFFSRGRLAQAQAEAQAAARLASEHELRLLQSQLEPHMLFNTLANLRVLIGIDPPRAQAMLDHMIGYLRATLRASRSLAHPLSAEFERLQDYLALMAIRMGPRLQVQLDLPETLRQVPVPPLLLQPLVENSIQHGLEPKLEGGCISVSAAREHAAGSDLLVLRVRDTGIGLSAHAAAALQPKPGQPAATGFGTAQVRERLQVLFGERAQFHLAPADDGEDGTLAVIRLPIVPAAADAPPDPPPDGV